MHVIGKCHYHTIVFVTTYQGLCYAYRQAELYTELARLACLFCNCFRVRTGPVLGFGPASFLLTRTGTGPFFEPASLPYSRNKFQIRVLRRQARVMPPLVRRGCESCVMKQHCYAAFEVCRGWRRARMSRGGRAPVPRIGGLCLHARSLVMARYSHKQKR